MKKILLVATIVALSLFSQQSHAQLFPRLRMARQQQYYATTGNYYVCPRCGHLHAYQRQNHPVAEIPKQAVERTTEALKSAVENTVDHIFIARANVIRASYGLQPLVVDSYLDQGSNQHANWMASYGVLQHATGYVEIIAQNWTGPFASFDQWLNSPAHRAILLSSYYTRAGFGYRRDSYGRIWCCMRFR